MFPFLLVLCLCLAGQTVALANDGAHRFLSAEDLVQQIVKNQTTVESFLDVTKSENGPDEKREHMRLNLVSLFPKWLDFTEDGQITGGFIIHLCLFVYSCLLLAVVIDSYFVQSLHYFSSVLRIPPNLAAPTLIAFGTSSPEFFTSVYSCLVAESSIATGAVVGSTLVNTLAIPGICGLAMLFTSDRSKLSANSKLSIIRDLLYFAIISIIFILAIKDNSVDSMEALSFLFLYLLYIFTLYIWANLKLNKSSGEIYLSQRRRSRYDSRAKRNSIESNPSSLQQSPMRTIINGPMLEDNTCIRYSLMPFLVVIRLTIPRPCKTFFLVTFAMSCIWIAMITYVNLWMVFIIGKTFNISEVVSGLTFLAFGANLPELLTSFILVRKYRLADMAICHTIGSNIFDILICLGLPWFLQILASTVRNGSELSELGSQVIPLEDEHLSFVCLSLFLSILAFSFILCLTNCELTVTTGVLCVFAYSVFIAVVLVRVVK